MFVTSAQDVSLKFHLYTCNFMFKIISDLLVLLIFVNYCKSVNTSACWLHKPVEKLTFTWAATWQNQQNDCAHSEDSDQPGIRPVWSES